MRPVSTHVRVGEQTPDEFREDIRKTKRLLEDTAGVPELYLARPGHAGSVKISPTITATDGFFPTLFQRTGFDNRTSMGLGTVQLVAPQLVNWDFPGRDAPWDRHTGAIGILQIKFVPEPSGRVMLVAGMVLLSIIYRRRDR